MGGWDFYQDAQGQVVMDYRLADIQDRDLILGKYVGQAGGQTRLILAGNID